jgi:hypothetical protein
LVVADIAAPKMAPIMAPSSLSLDKNAPKEAPINPAAINESIDVFEDFILEFTKFKHKSQLNTKQIIHPLKPIS